MQNLLLVCTLSLSSYCNVMSLFSLWLFG